jgi:hypothetical protein
MSSSQKAYLIMGALIVLSLGALLHGNMTLGSSREITNREKGNLNKVEMEGQLIFEHLERVRAQSRKINEEERGTLNMNTVLSLTKKSNLKAPSSSKENLVVRPTYNEKKIDLKLKDEYLDGVVDFMIKAEALGNAKISRIDIVRSSSDDQRWNCTLTIVQRIKKDLP